MFKKITALAILWGALVSYSTMAYTATDVNNANYLADNNIIRDWSNNPSQYQLDKYIARSSVIGILITMKWDTINESCRGDFADVARYTENDKWECRILETAADRGYINAMSELPQSMRRVRPDDHVTRSEAVGILMKAFDDTGAWAGFSYYWDGNLPVDGDRIGYKDAYNFWAPWQAAIMYSYVRKVLKNDLALRSDPLVNQYAQLKEVFEFAREIYS
jgi:hypothetical protein